MSCRKVYEFLSTFIVTGMRFLLSQQVWLSGDRRWNPREPGLAPQREGGSRSSYAPGAIPLLAQPLAFQICPSLEHASLVLLNSLLDTVPGESCP